MTLLLGPPSSGKTSLLLALAGKLDKGLKVNNYSYQNIYTYHCHYHCFSPEIFLKNHFTTITLKWSCWKCGWLTCWRMYLVCLELHCRLKNCVRIVVVFYGIAGERKCEIQWPHAGWICATKDISVYKSTRFTCWWNDSPWNSWFLCQVPGSWHPIWLTPQPQQPLQSLARAPFFSTVQQQRMESFDIYIYITGMKMVILIIDSGLLYNRDAYGARKTRKRGWNLPWKRCGCLHEGKSVSKTAA